MSFFIYFGEIFVLFEWGCCYPSSLVELDNSDYLFAPGHRGFSPWLVTACDSQGQKDAYEHRFPSLEN